MPQWLPSALIGLLFGIAVSILNYFILQQGIKKSASLPAGNGQNIIMARYGMRYILNILALVIVYENAPMLLGTALGLTANKSYLFFKYLNWKNFGKKGVN